MAGFTSSWSTGIAPGTSLSQGQSAGTSQTTELATSTPRYVTPDSDFLRKQYGALQDVVDTNAPQRAAIQTQRDLGDSLGNMLQQSNTGERARIGQDYDRAVDDSVGALAGRGQDASLAQETGRRGANREEALTRGQLSDRLLSKDVATTSQVQRSIADLLFGSSGQSMDLMKSLLGAGSVGHDRTSKRLGASESGGYQKSGTTGGGNASAYGGMSFPSQPNNIGSLIGGLL